jgi:hypothetical protein
MRTAPSSINTLEINGVHVPRLTDPKVLLRHRAGAACANLNERQKAWLNEMLEAFRATWDDGARYMIVPKTDLSADEKSAVLAALEACTNYALADYVSTEPSGMRTKLDVVGPAVGLQITVQAQ